MSRGAAIDYRKAERMRDYSNLLTIEPGVHACAMLFLPFAFNGPCASEAGPSVIYNSLKEADLIGEAISAHFFTQPFSVSAKEYLSLVYREVVRLSTGNTIYFGGNHLTSLPIHLYARDVGLVRVVLDAHRDYSFDSTNSTINHGNFLNYVPDDCPILLFGCRDEEEVTPICATVYRVQEIEDLLRHINHFKSEGYDFYLDIDFDVLSPSLFEAVTCPIEQGADISDIDRIITSITGDRLKIVSFSEYVPLLDTHGNLATVHQIVRRVLDEWSQ